MNRRELISWAGAGLATAALPDMLKAADSGRRHTNFIVVLCDDLGFGDIGPNGGRVIRTPNIDRMAAEGTVLTDFYAASNVCTSSRAGLLTGRYPIRTGLAKGVILQNDRRGLPLAEVTIAEALRPDYTSALIGKWHLGHVAPYWPPTLQGFDLFFGLPYSHDIQPLSLYESAGPGVELTKEDVNFPLLQQRFADRAEKFIEANASRPFFVELALSSPHLPNYPPAGHAGHSAAGAYGDTVEEIDAIVGNLVRKLKSLGIDRDTLLILTSDNGPWYEGSAGPLRARKYGGGYDGGYRVPFIARQPGVVPAGRRSNAITSGIDFLPTFCAMAGVAVPRDVLLDGKDISAVLKSGAPSPHDELILFQNEDVVAVRTQRWKYVNSDQYAGYLISTEGKGYPQLYDMAVDQSENYSVAARHSDVLAEMQARLKRAEARFAPLRTDPNSGIVGRPAAASPQPGD